MSENNIHLQWRADLHCHSSCSDGSFDPVQLVEHAHAIGLQGLAITDHDNYAAYFLARQRAEKLSLDFLPGIEFSSEYKGEAIHVLSYAFVLGHPAFDRLCENHKVRRYERALAILDLLKKKGIVIQREELPLEVIGRPHIAAVLLKKGVVGSIAEAFRRYLGKGGEVFVPAVTFSLEQTLEVIHEAKGLAVIAHPHLIRHKKIVQDIFSMPFDGVECYYGFCTLEQNAQWLAEANKKNWLVTGGSDFHGEIKPDLPLGRAWVTYERFLPLWTHFKNNCH